MSWTSARNDKREALSEPHQQTALPDTASDAETPPRHVHIAILGTGFSGLGMAIRLKQRGEDDFVIIEQADELGGTWRDNTYPGCACDIPSHLYSFSFAPNPEWSRLFPPQNEIKTYLRRCLERFGIVPHVKWNCALQEARWSEDEQRWQLKTSQGSLSADILILGNGPLSEPALPKIQGIEAFEGTLFHSARWRHDYDLTGKRVAVIGTGASAIQFVPQIQPKAGQISLFMRTPPWIVPRLDKPLPAWQHTLFRVLPLAQRLVRARMYLLREITALGFVYRPKILDKGMQVAREHLEKQVPDPELRAKLAPQYLMGCKRVLLSDDFYPALSQPNVELVTEHISEVRPHSVVTSTGQEYEVDTIICGTGFHVTDTQLPASIYGRGDISLADSWQDGPHAYLGTTVAGFPNLFLMIGPNTGLGHNSMVYMIESQVTYILDCLKQMKQRQLQTVEVRLTSEETFNAELQRRTQGTVWVSGCKSWYLDARGHNTTVWPGFTFDYRRRTRRFDAGQYRLQPLQVPVSQG